MSAASSPPVTAPAADSFPGDAPTAGRYDECRAADGTLRPHRAELLLHRAHVPAAR